MRGISVRGGGVTILKQSSKLMRGRIICVANYYCMVLRGEYLLKGDHICQIKMVLGNHI